MNDDLAARLRKALDGSAKLPPSVRNLLNAAAIEIERLRAQMARDKRGGKRSDDDGAAEVIPASSPKKPRGPLPSTAVSTKIEEGDEAR
jgi:hypothetical protein